MMIQTYSNSHLRSYRHVALLSHTISPHEPPLFGSRGASCAFAFSNAAAAVFLDPRCCSAVGVVRREATNGTQGASVFLGARCTDFLGRTGVYEGWFPCFFQSG